MKKILVLSLFVAVFSGCASFKDSNTANRATATGTIQKIGMTTFQYGTHLLTTENKTYALKSGSINLDQYMNKKVTIKGKKVKGYPLEGGPEFLDVTLIKF
ncbi:hypothetical protein EV200_101716 [Pedobacter psychrotolerans]|uniref:Lipoprotein n=1 Tax=Pedobacter psychrotolerans TaxID=1843235 RepID=A0A4R2HMC5_9SPHI|nr:hypothetical protein [Pedobacter psychrotolerans]TCO31268.1 hypothetical protein EV200_101716 [Pedobacter psychrotolerans]GGE40961.1 hypothetical protein GCM10011413_03520 [Pedobacter psychrotolerans]